MNLKDYFSPVQSKPSNKENGFGKLIVAHESKVPSLDEVDIVLFGCPEKRGAENHYDLHKATTTIRDHLRLLHVPNKQAKVVDLGDLRRGRKLVDTYKKLCEVTQFLLETGKRVIMIGGGQDMSFGQFLGVSQVRSNVSYAHIDSRLDFEKPGKAAPIDCFNSLIDDHCGDDPYTYINLGYQGYFVEEAVLEQLTKKNHVCLRYGEISKSLSEAEPELRKADMASFDLSAVKGADAPGAYQVSPAGFSASEICKLGHYAGLAYHLDSISISNVSPQLDSRDQTSMLAALIIWYIISGHYSRIDDAPRSDRVNMTKYVVKLHATVETINFFEHNHSGRWWMEVPLPEYLGKKKGKFELVPCSRNDYEIAKRDEIPSRWWRAFNQMSEGIPS